MQFGNLVCFYVKLNDTLDYLTVQSVLNLMNLQRELRGKYRNLEVMKFVESSAAVPHPVLFRKMYLGNGKGLIYFLRWRQVGFQTFDTGIQTKKTIVTVGKENLITVLITLNIP